MSITIYYPEKEGKEWRNLLRNPLFEVIYDYILTHENCILRELKRDIQDKGLEKTLDLMIDLKIVARDNRRYSILIVPKSEWNEQKSVIDLPKDRFSKEEWTVGFFEYLLSHPFKFKDVLFVERDSDLQKAINQFPIAQRLKEEKGLLVFHSFSQKSLERHTIGNFFERVEKNLPLTKKQQAVYQLFGDASPDYVLRAFGVWLLKFLKKDIVTFRRQEIFLQALVEFDYMEQVDDRNYRLCVPYLENSGKGATAYLKELLSDKSEFARLDCMRQILEELADFIYMDYLSIDE